MSEHLCHAKNCRIPVPPKMFMCRRHWFALPKSMRDAVWNAYIPGQERRKDPTEQYLAVVFECIKYISDKEKGTLF